MDRRGRIGLAAGAGVFAAVALLTLAIARGRGGVVSDAVALIGEECGFEVHVESPNTAQSYCCFVYTGSGQRTYILGTFYVRTRLERSHPYVRSGTYAPHFGVAKPSNS